MTPSRRSDSYLPGAELAIAQTNARSVTDIIGEPLDAELAVSTNCDLLIRLSGKTTWRIKMEPELCIAIAERLAASARVKLARQ